MGIAAEAHARAWQQQEEEMRNRWPNGRQRQMVATIGDDWRRTRRAGVELTDAREGVPIAASLSWLPQGWALSLALVISASVTRRRPASSSSVEAPMFPSFSPPIPIFYLTPGRFRVDFLFGVRVALIGSRSARYMYNVLLIYSFFEGTLRARRSASMTCHLIMDPFCHLRPLPSYSLPPLLAYGAHSIFRMVVCCLCV
jgi:hypothetical protein